MLMFMKNIGLGECFGFNNFELLFDIAFWWVESFYLMENGGVDVFDYFFTDFLAFLTIFSNLPN